MSTTTATNKSIAPTSVLTGAGILASAASTGQDTDTPTNCVKVLDAGSEGARIQRVYAGIRGTTPAGRIYLFRGSDSTGTTKRMITSKSHTLYTQSATVDPTTAQAPDFGFSDSYPLLLGPGESLWASESVALTGNPIVVHAEAGKFNTP